MTARAENDTGLLFVERNFLLLLINLTVLLVGKSFYVLAADNRLFDNLLAVLKLNLGVKPARRLNANQRTHLTEAVTAAFFHTDNAVVRFVSQFDLNGNTSFFKQFFKPCVNIKRAACNAARSSADKDFCLLRLERPDALLTQSNKVLP